jgi:hypothetical protein
MLHSRNFVESNADFALPPLHSLHGLLPNLLLACDPLGPVTLILSRYFQRTGVIYVEKGEDSLPRKQTQD